MSLQLYGMLVFMFIALTVLSSIIENNVGIATTTLTAQVGRTDTTLNVTRTQGFKPSGVLRIDNEVICYTGVTATTFTGLTRACRSSTAEEHSLNQSGVARKVYTRAGGIVNDLTAFDIKSAFSDGGVVGFFKGLFNSVALVPGMVSAIARMLIWDYTFLDGPYVYFKWVLLYPISAMMMMGMFKLALGR